jgi:hypothetical protein
VLYTTEPHGPDPTSYSIGLESKSESRRLDILTEELNELLYFLQTITDIVDRLGSA